MAAGIITRDQFSNFEPKLIAEAQYTLQHEPLMPQLFRNESLTEHMGPTWNQPRHGTVTATALTDGVPISIGQIPTQGNTAITPAEAGAEVIITKVALSSGRDNYMKQMGVVLADSMVKKIDTDGLGRFSDYTTIGTAGVSITAGHVNAASSRLRGNRSGLGGPPRGPFWFVHTPETVSVLLNNISATAGTYPIPAGLSQEVIEMYYAHDLKLFSLNGGFATGNLVPDASDDAVGAVFSKNATIYVEAHPTEFESDYDNELRGWNIVAVARYAYGTDVTSWGVGMTFDSAARVA